MAEMIPGGASSTCFAVALQDDDTSVPLSSVEGEMFVDPDHPNMVLEALNRLRLNHDLCDVILCCGGQEFSCHRNVLAACSTYFEGMFSSGMIESTQQRVQICGVEPGELSLLVSYAYTSTVYISMTNVQALLSASNLLDVKAVKQSCCRYLMRHMDEENCVGIHCFAEAHSCVMLERHSMDYILEHFSGVYQQEEFHSLSVERLTEILSSDFINVPSEDLVFEAAMLWVMHKCPTRRHSFEKVLDHIRLPLMSTSYLHHVIESLDLEYLGCQRFISEAKECLVAPNTGRPRRTTVIVTVGALTDWKDDNKVESLNPMTNQWKTLGCLPFEEPGTAVVMSGSTLYVVEGDSRTMWRYDIDSNSWTEMADMNTERSHFSLVMADGFVFAVGDSGGSKKTADSIDRYDPNTDTWDLWEDVGVPAHDHYAPAVVALDGQLYFIGEAATHQKPNHKYNIETSVWTEVAPMHIARDKPAACALNGKIYIIGGRHYRLKLSRRGRITENTMECYDARTNEWTMCAPMQMQRYNPSVAAMDGKIYVLGGLDGKDNYVPNIELYREETGTWETLGQMRARRYGLSCACLRLRNDHVPTADEDDEYYKDVDVETDEETDYDDYDDYVFFGPDYDYYEELRLVMGE